MEPEYRTGSHEACPEGSHVVSGFQIAGSYAGGHSYAYYYLVFAPFAVIGFCGVTTVFWRAGFIGGWYRRESDPVQLDILRCAGAIVWP
jgi:hypothetical protein